MIKEGDMALLVGKERRIIVRVKKGASKVGKGVADLSKIVGKEYGDSIVFWGEEFRIYRPSREDMAESMERGAQVILPKDAAQIIFICDISPGDLVLEGGSGSGWLTSFLARSVMPSGRVISYDISEKSLKIAEKNLENMGLEDYVDLRKGDIRDADIGEMVNSCILDIPDPWNAFDNVKKHLVPGGHICAYVPTYNQVEEAVLKMRRDFFDVKAMELFLRKMDVKKGATRPEFTGLLHTGFLIHGRKR